MLITVDVSAFYDWEPHDGVPSEEDLLALRAKPSQDGKSLKRVLKHADTQTQIGLPEAEIRNLMAHFERTGAPKSRERVVAFYLEDKVMPHHAHPDHWTGISVHDEPDVEAYLRNYFNLKGG
jgi:hypothetical protein